MPFDRRWIVVFVASPASGVGTSAGVSTAFARTASGGATGFSGAAGPDVATSRAAPGTGAGAAIVSGFWAGPHVVVVAIRSIARKRFHRTRVTHARRHDSMASVPLRTTDGCHGAASAQNAKPIRSLLQNRINSYEESSLDIRATM